MQGVTRLALAALLLHISATISFAQSGLLPRPTHRHSNPLDTEGQRLFVVIEANAGKQSTDIQQIVKLGLEHLKKERRYEFDEVKVQPVSSSLYHGMKSLFRGEGFDSTPAETGLSVRRIPGGKSIWEVLTGGPLIRAKSFTVFFEKDEDGKIITVSPPLTFPTAPVSAIDQPFRFYSPGTYLFSFEGEIPPTRYQLELVSDSSTEKEPEVLSATWPQENVYYLLLIDKFVGDRRMLFEILKNNRVVGNGLKDVQTVESATISLATFIDPIDTGTSSWDDDRHYHVRIKKPDDKFPKRVWFFFPADSETVSAEFGRLKAICDQGAFERQQLLETIRATAILATNNIPLKADSAPAWYEITSETREAGFSRLFEVAPGNETPAGRDDFHGLSIFEFNEEVILSVGNSYVQKNEHPRWFEGLRKLKPLPPSLSLHQSTTPQKDSVTANQTAPQKE